MASTSDNAACRMKMKLECIIHVSKTASGKVTAFTNISKAKVIRCAKEWKALGGEIGDFANTILSDNADLNLTLDTTTCGYHRQCYMKFTDVSKISRAKSKLTQSVEDLPAQTDTADLRDFSHNDQSESMDQGPAPKLLRSVHTLHSGHILPPVCIICQKVSYVTNSLTKKRSKERLVECQTVTAGSLQTAAQIRNDNKLLLHIRDQDLVALEAMYHKTCYQQYVRVLSTQKKQDGLLGKKQYQKAYEIFCHDIVEEKIVKNAEIFRLTKLLQIFKGYVQKFENLDAANYRTYSLQHRLKGSYPQLVFLRPSRKNLSCLVYSDNLTTAHVVEDLPFDDNSSESSTSDTADDIIPSVKNPSPTSIRDLYMSAQNLKSSVTQHQFEPMEWPPTAAALNFANAERIVPTKLYNFLAWVVGASEEPVITSKVKVEDSVHHKLLSVAQDVMQLAFKGKKMTPKYLSLGMAVRHITGSAQLIGLLNGLGHCSSHSVVLEHDTALAQQHLDHTDALPATIVPGKFLTFVWDNIDFGEETLTGKGTTHSTNGIAIQRGKHDLSGVQRVPLVRRKQRSIKAPPSNIMPYFGVKKHGPRPFGDQLEVGENVNLQNKARLIDLTYNLLKAEYGASIPTWTGYNIGLCPQVPVVSQITYLPVINASPTEYDTLHTVLQESLKIADKSSVNTVVVVMDEATYAKAQQIRWTSEVFRNRIVMRLGEFHVSMAYLACIGSRFGDAGLRDLLIESNIVAQGSINGVLNGHHYNRSVRTHKLAADALSRLRWLAFLDTLNDQQREEIRMVLADLHESYLSNTILDFVRMDELKMLQQQFQQFISRHSAVNPTFAFWSSYLEMVQLLLLFLRATREGNWELHLSTVRSMLPWFFACDRVHYSRYLPVYWLEMKNLPESHPDVHENLSAGEFVVQRQDQFGFSQIACDQTIEQTCNRDTKTKGGLTGFTLNRGAVHRWILSSHERAAITKECQTMAGKFLHSRKKDLDKTRICKDEEHTNLVMATVESMINPFEPDQHQLVNISSGVVATDDVCEDLLSAQEVGETAVQAYCKERLQQGDKDVFATLRKCNLKSFTSMVRKVKSNQKGKEIVLKSDRNLFARLLLIGSSRQVDIKEMLSYSLGIFPLSIATCEGSLVKTNKAKMMQFLEEKVDTTLYVERPPMEAAWIVDGMALLQQLKNPPATFGLLARHVLDILLNLARSNNAMYVHFVTDRYLNKSIKNAEREKRGVGGTEIFRIYSDDQSVPKQWKKFLSASTNKESLVKYVFQKWASGDMDLHGVVIFIAHDQECHQICATESGVECKPVPALQCNHEEADTRIFLHCSYASSVTKCNNIIIKSPDTDVMIIAVAMCSTLSTRLFFSTGVGNKKRIIDVAQVANNVGTDICSALIGFHVFTGCDSVSSFYGKGKVKCLKVLKSRPEFCNTFSSLGETFDVPNELSKALQSFVCCLYGQTACTDVNQARLNLFRLDVRCETGMPPTQDALHKHILRANYQTAIHKLCFEQFPEVPPPISYGWKVVDDSLDIDWMDCPPAPDSVLEFVQCGCKKSKCRQRICSCVQNGLPCTDLCRCSDCDNKFASNEVEEEEVDTDEEVI